MMRSLFLALLACASIAHAGSPNVVLMLIDDAGIEAFSCYGSESCATPNIDRLASEGVRFTQMHAQPLCTPSRVKMLTGKSNLRNYWRFSVLLPGERTIAHEFREAGYRTAAVGKWQLLANASYAWANAGSTPEQAGFDEHCLWQVTEQGSRYHDPNLVVNGERLQGTWGRYGPDIFVTHAIDVMSRAKASGTPFFLYYPLALTHDPFVPTPDSDDPSSTDLPSNFRDMVTYLDDVVGRMSAALDDLGLADDTIVLLTSDNGTSRAIRLVRNGKEVRGGKSTPTDQGTHVPMIVRWPGHAIAGSTCDDLVDLSDIMPTLLEAAGIALPPPGTLDGRSFLPQVRGERGTPRDWIHIYCNARPERDGVPVHWFVRSHTHKLYRDGRLFDLEHDPDETTPVLPEQDTPDLAEARATLRLAFDEFPEHPVRIEPEHWKEPARR